MISLWCTAGMGRATTRISGPGHCTTRAALCVIETGRFSDGRCLLSDRSLVPGRIAAMKPSEHARHHQADEKSAQSRRHNVARGVQIKISNTAYEDITDGQIEKSPKHIDGRGRKSLARRFGKRTLKRTSHHAADKMRNGVGEKNTAEKVGRIVNPFHHQGSFTDDHARVLLRRSMISFVVPVSPSR